MISRKWSIGAGVVAAGAIAWRALDFTELAHIGAGYSAQQTCACLFVAGRTLESCQTDLEPLARKLVSLHPGDHQVTARAFGFSTATARYQKEFGCSLQD